MSTPKTEPAEGTFDWFLAQPDISAAIKEARAQNGENLAGLLSAWGPFIVVRKPTFEEELAFHASQSNQSPTKQKWGSILLVEACLIYPDHQEFKLLREQHGYLFADNVCAIILERFGPQDKVTESKKI